MIPRLYETQTGTNRPTQSQLIAPLADTISCYITEELNGMYELEMQYPTNGKWFTELMTYNVLVAANPYRVNTSSVWFMKDNQVFHIYKRTIDGDILTVNAHHCSYQYCNQIIYTGFNYPTVTDVRTVMTALGAALSDPTPTTTPFVCTAIKTKRKYLLDSEYSAASVYGMEFFFWDNTVTAYTHRGKDWGVELRLGKNITSAWAENDLSDSFNCIFPFWEKDGVRVIANIGSQYYPTHIVYPTNPPAGPEIPVVMDFTDQFETAPTSAELETAARDYLDTYEPWNPKESVEIGFFPLLAENLNASSLIEGVGLGDDVTVYWADGGLDGVKLRAVKYVYNVLLERFDEIQLGTLEKGYVVTSDGKISAVQSSSGGGGGVPAIYLTSVPCSAMTGNFVDYNDGNITEDYVVAECVFASPSAITTDVSWTTSAGNIKLNGTCSSATTCNLVLVSQ